MCLGEGETEARSGLGTRGAGAGVNTALWESLGSQAGILGGSDISSYLEIFVRFKGLIQTFIIIKNLNSTRGFVCLCFL